ncbi:spore coat U domain-containing protein [Luteimonas sp. S4-F44]|uniref:Csu type fimbrial protein n=1 Tax=Luteimonas sp. S4-F44 TaxID=2925842 RepID=UPI001F53B351|nr:spore coat U domain-containing protein [Luteimonas sp. S4-F44]UNK41425.1 spore coat U domain-containing protein [Luteimonas sp. S4-F44]
MIRPRIRIAPPARSRQRLRLLLLLALLAAGGTHAQDTGSCTVASAQADLGTVGTLALAEGPRQAAGNGGLTCGALAFISTSYIKVRLENSTFQLAHDGGGPSLPFTVLAQSTGPQIGQGQEFDFSGLNLLNLFNGPGGSLPLYVRTTPTAGLRAGTYTGMINLRWFFSVCTVGLGPVCVYSQSPGFQRPGLFTPLNWGTGIPTSVRVVLRLENDCAIAAPPLNFGSAPLAGAFGPVVQQITVRCSAGAAYSVGIDDGQHFAGGWRRMRDEAAPTQFLRYALYKGAGSGERWGSVGAERRTSATAEANPGLYTGTAAQGFTYRALIDPTQTTPPPGVYRDTLRVDIRF